MTLSYGRVLLLVAVLGAMALFPSAASAQILTINVHFDENCVGMMTNSGGFSGPLPCFFTPDPGPGGLPNVMFYDLINPPGLVGGDVVITEPTGGISDILRFTSQTGTGGVFVYSDFEPGEPFPALADVGLPTGRNTNLVTVTEVGPEGNNGIVYTPFPGQPGFVIGEAVPVTYTFISDADVPEPGTIGLLLAGSVALLMRRRKP